MDAEIITKIKGLDKLEMLVAFIKCFDGDGGQCHGCPLEDESGCAYELKMEIAKRLMGGERNA